MTSYPQKQQKLCPSKICMHMVPYHIIGGKFENEKYFLNKFLQEGFYMLILL